LPSTPFISFGGATTNLVLLLVVVVVVENHVKDIVG